MISMVNNIQIQSMYEPLGETRGFESHSENNSDVIITKPGYSLTITLQKQVQVSDY